MKKMILGVALALSTLTIKVADAQVRLGVSINIGSQPDWGPVGYDHVDYYYMPDVDAYYDVPAHQYVYYENNTWVRRASLPARYRNYDVYNGYKVVVNRPTPWVKNTYYRTTYAKYRGKSGQTIIRDSRDAKYQKHWKDNNGRGNNGNDNGNHGNKGNGNKGNGRGNGHGNGHGKH